VMLEILRRAGRGHSCFSVSLFIFCVSCAVVERGSFHLSLLLPAVVIEKPVSGKSVMQRAEKTGGGRK